MAYRTHQCKRDALPTELSALTRETAHLRAFFQPVKQPLVERKGYERNFADSRVPNYSRSSKKGADPGQDRRPYHQPGWRHDG
jgi:hypothetical protein